MDSTVKNLSFSSPWISKGSLVFTFRDWVNVHPAQDIEHKTRDPHANNMPEIRMKLKIKHEKK